MGELTASFDLPLGPEAGKAARAATTTILASWGAVNSEWLADAQLVVTELVTNAVRHGGGLVELAFEKHDTRVTISVSDGSAVLPELRQPTDDGGRGLMLITALTQSWGVEDHRGGKRVGALLKQEPT